MRAFCFLLFAGFTPSSFGWEYDYAVGGSYSEGTYGRDATTRISQASTAIGARATEWRARLTVLWMNVDGTRDDPSIYAIKHTSGWADSYVLVEHALLARANWRIYAGAQAKLPLASYSSGLSTGHRDGALHIGAQLGFSTYFTLFAQSSYWWREDPVEIELLNRTQTMTGIYWRTHALFSLGAKADYLTRAVAAGSAQSSILIFASVTPTSQWSLTPYALIGRGPATPAWAGGLEMRYRWGQLAH